MTTQEIIDAIKAIAEIYKTPHVEFVAYEVKEASDKKIIELIEKLNNPA